MRFWQVRNVFAYVLLYVYECCPTSTCRQTWQGSFWVHLFLIRAWTAGSVGSSWVGEGEGEKKWGKPRQCASGFVGSQASRSKCYWVLHRFLTGRLRFKRKQTHCDPLTRAKALPTSTKTATKIYCLLSKCHDRGVGLLKRQRVDRRQLTPGHLGVKYNLL